MAVFDGVAGVEPQSETVWHQANKYQIPRIAYVNKMDRPGADFYRCVEEIKRMLGATPAVLYLPYYKDQEFHGVINVLKYTFIQLGKFTTLLTKQKRGYSTSPTQCRMI